MENLTLILIGTITAQQPLTTTPPHVKSGDKEPKHLPTMSISVNGLRERFPYFPSTGIKGKLRRSAVDFIRNTLIKRTGIEKPFTRGQHYLLTTGGNLSKGQQDASGRDPMQDQNIRNVNPLLSLFGAGNPFVTGRIAIDHATPVNSVSVDVISGVRTDDLQRSPENLNYLNEASIDAFYQTTQLNSAKSKLKTELKNTRIKASMTDEEKAVVSQKITDLKAEIEALENKLVSIGSSTVSMMLPLDGYEVMPAGTQLNHRISIKNGTKAEIGLLLHTLRCFASNPIIGGHVANGCGEVSMSYKAFFKATPYDNLNEIGTVSLDMMSGLTIEGDFLKEAVELFVDQFDAFNFGDLEKA